MQNKWHEHSVGNIVVNFPLSSAIFRAAGIDYCCGGGRLLGEVIKEQRLVDSNIYKALDELAAVTEKPAEPFSEMSAERLVEFILTKHTAICGERFRKAPCTDCERAQGPRKAPSRAVRRV